MKKLYVVKIGGSNLKSSDDIKSVINIISLYPKPLIVVVSAFYGVTNKLLDIIYKANTANCKEAIQTKILTEIKLQIIDQLVNNEKSRNIISEKIQARIYELDRYLLGISYINEIPDSIYDIILSYGERLSSLIISELLNFNEIASREVFPEELKIVTNGVFKNATIDIKKTKDNFSYSFDEEKVYVVPGFYGVSENGKVNILGRGGSDYAAAGIARCVNAISLDVWKDVDGYMTSDPGIINQAYPIKNLSYAEAAELSYFGAKILHPRTVEPLYDSNIPIRIFNKNKANIEKPFSVINGLQKKNDSVIKSVVHSNEHGLLLLSGPGVGINPGILSKVTLALEKESININSVFTSQTRINLLLPKSMLFVAKQTIEDNTIGEINDIKVKQDISIIAAVGAGIPDHPGLAGKLFGALAENNINVEIISAGASDVAIYIMVDQQDSLKSLSIIHNVFFN